MKLINVILMLMVTLLPLSAQAWWNEDWAYRKQIHVDVSDSGVPIAVDMADVPVAIRLHSGNFRYFLDVKPDGSDLRFIAADDKTPLAYHIERFDQLAGIGIVWVRIPRLSPQQKTDIWMYYNNPEASPAQDSPASYDVHQTLVYHFNEAGGLPKDATAFDHHAVTSSAQQAVPGLIDSGIALDGTESVTLPETPVLQAGADTGFTVATWLKTVDAQQDGLLFSQGDAQRSLSLSLYKGHLVATLHNGDNDNNDIRVESATGIVPDRWQHVALTIGRELVLFMDGVQTASAPLPVGNLAGPLVVGTRDGAAGFDGSLDELELSNVTRPADWIKLLSSGQGADSLLLTYGEDESAQAGGGAAEYFGLLWSLFDSIHLDGWAILASIAIFGLLSADVIVGRAFTLNRVEAADDRFQDEFSELFKQGFLLTNRNEPAPVPDARLEHSTLYNLFEAGRRELVSLPPQGYDQACGVLNARGLEVLRTGLDAELVAQTNRLNQRLVLVTIAVSGGPFLGLLGTVVGVMITFATIAAAGDVNVNTIAPGVASALTTTVMGLLVAIPSLFGYNYLAGRIARRISVMEVFIDRLLSRLAMSEVKQVPESARNAA